MSTSKTSPNSATRFGFASLFVASAVMVLSNMGGCASTGAPAYNSLTHERIAAIIASPDRSNADRTNDLRRKPEQMLAFIGIQPGQIALDLSAGGGYTTELLARSVGPSGRAYGQSQPPRPTNAPPRPGRTSAQALAERAKNPSLSNLDRKSVV